MIYETRRFSGKVELSTMWKRFLLTTAFASLFFVFAACDDDGSSVVEPGDESSSAICEDCDDSSSSVKSSSSVTPKSSESAKSSSSVTPKSSSSETSVSSSNAKSSSSTKSSSSSVTPKSSSSETSVSSSSAKSSSSVTPKSSSSVKSSSSFEVDTARLCTPDYDLCDRALSGDSIRSGAYKQFTDKRNGRKYYYLTINGENKDGQAASVTVMAENLNIGEMVSGDKDQSNDSKIERYCYENDESNCEEYGGLYQWAEAMQLPSECNTKSCADQIKPNHRGICPEGWRLLTYDDFYIVVHADGNRHGVEDVRAMGFGGHNYSGYSLIGAGYNWNYKFRNLNETTYWFYPEEGSLDKPAALSGSQSKSSTGNASQSVYKTHGMSIRCVMAE